FHGYFGRIEDVADQLPENAFDLIVILQVLEHVEEPALVVGTLAKLLGANGVLIIETPNTKSLDVNIFRNRYWGGYNFPRHWNLFDKNALTRMVEGNALAVKQFNFLPAQTFWVYSLHHIVDDRASISSLAKFLDPFQNVFLIGIATAFDIVRARLGFKTSN